MTNLPGLPLPYLHRESDGDGEGIGMNKVLFPQRIIAYHFKCSIVVEAGNTSSRHAVMVKQYDFK